jgi:hypothetical protein
MDSSAHSGNSKSCSLTRGEDDHGIVGYVARNILNLRDVVWSGFLDRHWIAGRRSAEQDHHQEIAKAILERLNMENIFEIVFAVIVSLVVLALVFSVLVPLVLYIIGDLVIEFKNFLKRIKGG